jgi:hypothetical protein
MKTIRAYQRGGSVFVNTVLLLALAYGLYVGFHYAPIFIESRTIDGILNNLRLAGKTAPFGSRYQVETQLDRELNINGMTHLRDRFQVVLLGDGYEVQVEYERPLDLLYEQKMLKFNKILILQ